MRRRTFLATVGVASGAALAGCGDTAEDPASRNESNAARQVGGDAQAGTPDAASTPDEPATPDETTTPAESTGTEASATEETSTDGGTSTPGEAGGGRNTMEYPSEYVDVRDVEYDDNEDADRGPTVTGVVQNVSSETLSLVEAKVWSYDDGDEETGEALDDTTDLGPGRTWEFECELWDTEAGEVAYWKGRVDVSTY